MKDVYEIINPSDPYTIRGEYPIVCAAVLLLGRGKMGLDPCWPDGKSMPVFLFATEAEIATWFERETGATIEAACARRRELAAAYDSVLIGNSADRETFEKDLTLIADPAKQAEWREHWHDRRRSSMSDIGRAAWRRAERLRDDIKGANEGAT